MSTLAEIQADKKSWQRLLRLAGFYTGAVDGIIGPKSQAAGDAWVAKYNELRGTLGVYDARTEGNLITLLPIVQEAARKWLAAVQASGVIPAGHELKIISGVRSYAEQDALYKKRPVVTKAEGGYSWHNFGTAWDVGIFCGVKYLDESPLYKKVGKVACAVVAKLEWGGNWTSLVDEPHYQVNIFSSLAVARSKAG